MVQFFPVCRFLVACLYTVLGLAGFATFIYFKNYPSAVLGMITGITNGLLSHLHLLDIKGTLNQWYSDGELRQMERLGFGVFCTGTMSLTYHTVIEIMLRKYFLTIREQMSRTVSMFWNVQEGFHGNDSTYKAKNKYLGSLLFTCCSGNNSIMKWRSYL